MQPLQKTGVIKRFSGMFPASVLLTLARLIWKWQQPARNTSNGS